MARKSFVPLKTAEELFTDREEPRYAFWNMLKELESDEQGKGRVIAFYGEGGIGKTWLLKRIESELKKLRKKYADPEEEIEVSDIDFNFDYFKAEYVPIYCELEENSDIVEILCGLRTFLFKEKPNFEFPVFDYAVKKYEDLVGRKILPDLVVSDSKIRMLDAIFSKVSLIPGLSSVGELYTQLKSAKGFTETVVKGMKDTSVVKKIEGNESVKKVTDAILDRIQDPIVRAQIREVEKIDTTEDLIRSLPVYFAADLSDEKRDFSIVFLIDTFEILNPNNELPNSCENVLKNQLARGIGSQIEIEDALWVLAGRNRIYDDESVSQHLIGDLSKEDTVKYLKKQDIFDEDIIETIYEITGGTPIFLDVCVRNYIAENRPCAADFEVIDKNELIRRYLRYRDNEERLIIRTMSSIMHWTDKDFEEVFCKAFDVPWRVYQDAYRNVIQTTMIEKINDERYFFHRSVRAAIYDDANYVQEDKDKTLDALINLYSEKVECKDSDQVYYKDRIVELLNSIMDQNRKVDADRMKKLLKISRRSASKVIQYGVYHLESYIAVYKRMLGMEWDEKTKIRILISIGDAYWEIDDFGNKVEYDEQLYEKVKEVYGENDPLTMEALGYLTFDYSILDERGEYLEFCQNSYEKSKTLLGEDHQTTLEMLLDLAAIYGDMENNEKAAELAKEVYEKRSELLGENDRNTLTALRAMASYLKDNFETLKVNEKIYRMRKDNFGEEDFQTMYSLHDIGDSYKYLEDDEKAKEFHQMAYEKRKVIMGENHPQTLDSLRSLAADYGNLGNHKKAAELLEQEYEKRKLVLGEYHWDTLESLRCLSNEYYALNDLDRSISLNREYYERKKAILGEDHQDTIDALYSLINKYNENGNYEKAAELDEQIWNKNRSVLGEDHPDTLVSLRDLAIDYEEMENYQKALQLYEEVYEKRKRILGDDHPDTLISLKDIADCHAGLDETEKAEESYRQMFETIKNVHKEYDQNILSFLDDLAKACFALQDYELSLEINESVFEGSLKIFGEDDLHTLRVMHNRALVYEKQERFEDAVDILKRVYEKKKLILGENHPSAVGTYEVLNRCKKKMQEKIS